MKVKRDSSPASSSDFYDSEDLWPGDFTSDSASISSDPASTSSDDDSVDSQAITTLSETSEVASICGREAGYDGDEEHDSDDYLTKRAQELADEYLRKSDFRVKVKK